MRGFAITLDAVIALSFFLFAMLLMSGQTYQPMAPGSIYLKQLTLDTLAVLEKTGRLGRALDGNNSGVEEVLEATPKLACIQLSILDSEGNPAAVLAKNDCNETGGLDMQVVSRPVLHNGIMYVVRSESWLRKEPE
ncbi:MAG: hypothetical protein PHV13_02080 [Candidatus ainarchaeum sp.]|nr:hypothetical protein [Candidatus ainarchaeum sp.]